MPAPLIEVDNPKYEPGHPGSIRTVTVVRALRDDPLARMHHRGQIDDAKYEAGKRYLGLLEASEVGRVRSQDMSREPVDGGGHVPEILTERQQKARKGVIELSRILGQEPETLLRMFLVDRMSMAQIAAARPYGGAADVRKYVGTTIDVALQALAVWFGLAHPLRMAPNYGTKSPTSKSAPR